MDLLVELVVWLTIDIERLEGSVAGERNRVGDAVSMLLSTKDLPFHIMWRLYEDDTVGIRYALECNCARLLAGIIVGVRIEVLPSHVVDF